MTTNLIDAFSWIDTVAATVWILLTVVMFWILYQVYGMEGRKHPVFKFGVFLLVLVWLYPLYTFMFNQLEVGFFGNLLTLGATAVYMKKLKNLPFKKYYLLVPQLFWLVLASVYVGLLLLEKMQTAY